MCFLALYMAWAAFMAEVSHTSIYCVMNYETELLIMQ